jgi:hypothetical protein
MKFDTRPSASWYAVPDPTFHRFSSQNSAAQSTSSRCPPSGESHKQRRYLFAMQHHSLPNLQLRFRKSWPKFDDSSNAGYIELVQVLLMQVRCIPTDPGPLKVELCILRLVRNWDGFLSQPEPWFLHLAVEVSSKLERDLLIVWNVTYYHDHYLVSAG